MIQESQAIESRRKSGPKPVSITERWLRYVDPTRDGCWEWQGGIYKRSGYGKFAMVTSREEKRVTGYAHRAAWEIFFGPIPAGLSVLHKCDNPPCANPWYLFLGSQMDNIVDCIQKGRKRTASGPNLKLRGACHPNVKLSDMQVLEIVSSPLPNREVAALYGVAHTHVSAIRTGKARAHVTRLDSTGCRDDQ